MKKILKNNEKTRKYLNSLPKVYIIAYWAKWGVLELPFSGKFTDTYYIDNHSVPIPLVYDYFDGNGTCDEYHLKPISNVTTGFIMDWTFFKDWAEKSAELLNSEEQKEAEAKEFNADHKKRRGGIPVD